MTRATSAALLCLAATTAHGFQIDSAISKGCHEKMAAAAAVDLPWPNGAKPPAPTAAVRALAADVEFTPPRDADLWTLGLLLGVRDNDLEGAGTLDLPDLAAVHNGLADQDAHCLRADTDDGPEGDVKALAACRAFALKEVALALGGGDQPDLEATVTVKLALRFERGMFEVPRYAFHLGKAMHSVQDGFSHTFRTAGYARVQSVLNWIDPVMNNHYLASRDGYAHLSTLDHCVPDAVDLEQHVDVAGRVDAATQASRTLFQTVSAGPDRAARLAAVNALFDQWFQYEPGCDESNGWCGNVTPAKGCSAVGGEVLWPLLAVGALAFRRRAARRGAGAAPHAASDVEPAAVPRVSRLRSGQAVSLRHAAIDSAEGERGSRPAGRAPRVEARGTHSGPRAAPAPFAGSASLAALAAAALLCVGAPASAEPPPRAVGAQRASSAAEAAPANATAKTAANTAASATAGRTERDAPAGATAAGATAAGATAAGATAAGGTAAGATPADATPTGATPTDATPAGATPTDATPAGATPAGATPAGATPAGATPAGATAAGATAAGATPADATSAAAEVAVPIHQEPARRWSLRASLGFSLDRGGGNLSVGAGLALARFVRLRADLEWNPWFDSVSGAFAAGAMNAYFTFMMTWIHLGPIELSSSVSLGASLLLFSPAGATAGSVGVYLGASALRLGINLGDSLTLELTPEAAIPIPSLRGVPFAYLEYRLCAGLRWDLRQ